MNTFAEYYNKNMYIDFIIKKIKYVWKKKNLDQQCLISKVLNLNNAYYHFCRNPQHAKSVLRIIQIPKMFAFVFIFISLILKVLSRISNNTAMGWYFFLFNFILNVVEHVLKHEFTPPNSFVSIVFGWLFYI